MFFKLVFVFIGVPFIEMMILIKLGSVIGFWDTMLIVVLTGLTGAALARWQGLRVWFRIQEQLQRGAMPAVEMMDGLLIFAAGLVLITPGLLTDALGFLLLIPTTRNIFKRWLRKKFLEMSEKRQGDVMIFLE